MNERLGNSWKEKVYEKAPSIVKKCENTIRKRPDKEKAKDFLDGATLGELTNIIEIFSDIFDFNINLIKGFLNILNQHRKILIHPLKEEPEKDLDEKTYKKISAALDYIESIIY